MADHTTETESITKRRDVYIICNNEEVLNHLRQSNDIIKKTHYNINSVVYSNMQLEQETLDQLGPQHLLICIPVYASSFELRTILDYQQRILNRIKMHSGQGEILPPFNPIGFTSSDALMSNIQQSVTYLLKNYLAD